MKTKPYSYLNHYLPMSRKRDPKQPASNTKLIVYAALLSVILGFWYCQNQPTEQTPVAPPESGTPNGKTPAAASARSVRIVSWNLFNFGKSKDEKELDYIAEKLKGYDIAAIQEISTGPAGAQAIARLADALNRKGAQWDYVVSDPTTGAGPERYAYLWKPSKARIKGRAWLEPTLAEPIDREPYLARFTVGNQDILLVNFHAIPTSKDPENEIVLLPKIEQSYPKDKIVYMGDFNLSQKHKAWDGLKNRGFQPLVTNQKTSLKMKESDGEWLANEYDNIFYREKQLKVENGGVVEFFRDFPTLAEARDISDHIPVWFEVRF